MISNVTLLLHGVNAPYREMSNVADYYYPVYLLNFSPVKLCYKV